MPESVKITFLGGLGNIGRNCAAVEINNKIMLIDCGILFPDGTSGGVDLILPDFTYLLENIDKVVGVVATHGHEDHIGAISYLLEHIPLKIIGSQLTIGFVKNRVDERKPAYHPTYITVEDNQSLQIDGFDLEFFPVTHSVPNGFSTAFHTPQGVVLHSGDFKLDMCPVDGRRTDLAGIGALSTDEGVKLLLCDSTNAESQGYSASETSIGHSLRDLFFDIKEGRLIVACFASHIHRIQQIADAAIANGRKIATLGLSMKKNVELAQKMGLLNISSNYLIDIGDIDEYPDSQICVISTGSQGEPMSALTRMAMGGSHWLNIRYGDTVILSSHPIPGNESSISKVINALMEKGANVIHSGNYKVHATGHAKAEELKIFHSIVKPDYFIPVHGEFRHMAAHAEIAKSMGLKDENIMICRDGNSVILDDSGLSRGDNVSAEYIYIGNGSERVDETLISERMLLGNAGFVGAVVVIGKDDNDSIKLLKPPYIFSKGWLSGEESKKIHDNAQIEVKRAIETAINKGQSQDRLIKVARRALGKFVDSSTGLRPVVVPVIIEN